MVIKLIKTDENPEGNRQDMTGHLICKSVVCVLNSGSARQTVEYEGANPLSKHIFLEYKTLTGGWP